MNMVMKQRKTGRGFGAKNQIVHENAREEPSKPGSKYAQKPKPKPLNPEKLRDLALYYVGRFANTQAGVRTYLQRKVRERGWEEEMENTASTADSAIDMLIVRLVELRYIDDAAFATAKADGLMRRGYGGRRVESMLYQSKIAEDDAMQARDIAQSQRWTAAVRFAQKKRLGPFAAEDDARPDIAPDFAKARADQQKALAAFLRAGHGFADAQRLLLMPPGADIDAYGDDE